MKGQKVIIIKKVKKGGHGGGHGGSWKVAYADFVTAMMAFFLLMWLLNMSSPELRIRLSYYFDNFSLFETGSSSSTMGSFAVMRDSTGKGKAQKQATASAKTKSDESGVGKSISKDDLAELLKGEMQGKLSGVQDQVLIDVFEGGVRIQLVDFEGRPLFEVGSAEPTPMARDILKVVAASINEVTNKVAIEGHTDARGYATGKYTNWELSTARASSARAELERYGLDPDRLSKVAGYASTVPLIEADPMDTRNRRISIILMYPSMMQKPEDEELGPEHKDGQKPMPRIELPLEIPRRASPFAPPGAEDAEPAPQAGPIKEAVPSQDDLPPLSPVIEEPKPIAPSIKPAPVI